MKDLIKILNRQVANLGVLYIKLHHFHWYIKGVEFYQLHVLFEKLYDEVTAHLDSVAERILMLDDKPISSLKEFLELATIKEAVGNETLLTMVEEVISDFSLLNQEMSEGIKIAQDHGDEVTVDLLIGIISSLQKHLWMLKTTLK